MKMHVVVNRKSSCGHNYTNGSPS